MEKNAFEKLSNGLALLCLVGVLVTAICFCLAGCQNLNSEDIKIEKVYKSAYTSPINDYNDTTRLFSDLNPGYGSAVYFTGEFADGWKAAFRGTYSEKGWYYDIPAYDTEWKCLTGAWDLGEVVEAPFTGLIWESGENRIYVNKEIDFSDIEATKQFWTLYDVVPDMEVTVDPVTKKLTQKATVYGTEFSLITDFSLWNGILSYKKAKTCSKLFWKLYPVLYKRVHNSKSYTKIEFQFHNAGIGGNDNFVGIEQQFFVNHPYDYDCLTHEFAHKVQGQWDGHYCPSVEKAEGGYNHYFVERFADILRYEYAFENGYYNDVVWNLADIYQHSTYVDSNRFWVWLDYTYSTEEADIMARINNLVCDQKYPCEEIGISGDFWKEVFTGTKAENLSIYDLWKIYRSKSFSRIKANVNNWGAKSDLIKDYDVRNIIRSRYSK